MTEPFNREAFLLTVPEDMRPDVAAYFARCEASGLTIAAATFDGRGLSVAAIPVEAMNFVSFTASVKVT